MERSVKSPDDNIGGVDEDAQTTETEFEYSDIETDNDDYLKEDW